MRRPGASRALAAVAALALVSGCDRGEPGRVPADVAAADVRVSEPVVHGAWIGVPGTVRSTREAEVATRLSGRVEGVAVDVGRRVQAGAALVVLDDADASAAVRRARAELERARAYHGRIASLARDGAATAQELDDALAGLESAEAALEAARAQLDYVVIRAPFAGVVTARHVDPGDLAVPGMPVVALVGPETLEIEADVPAERAGDLVAGSAAAIESGDGRSLPATLRSVSPALDPASRRVRVKLDFAPDLTDLPPAGSFVRVRWPDRRGSSLWVPADAVVRRGQMTGLYVVEGDRIRLRWVRTGERLSAEGDEGAAALEVLAGIGPEDRVVRRPSPTLRDGVVTGDVELVPWKPEGVGP